MIPNGKSSVYVEEAHIHDDEKCIYVKIERKKEKEEWKQRIFQREKKIISHRSKKKKNRIEKKNTNQLRWISDWPYWGVRSKEQQQTNPQHTKKHTNHTRKIHAQYCSCLRSMVLKRLIYDISWTSLLSTFIIRLTVMFICMSVLTVSQTVYTPNIVAMVTKWEKDKTKFILSVKRYKVKVIKWALRSCIVWCENTWNKRCRDETVDENECDEKSFSQVPKYETYAN